LRQGGKFISILGTTKLGKSTLVKDSFSSSLFSIYIPGQNLAKEGEFALWRRLAADLGIATSTQKGKVVGDKSRWGFMARFGITVPMFTAAISPSVGGEHYVDTSTTETHDVDIATAVTQALTVLAVKAREDGVNVPIIAVDDFHFIEDVEKRREIIRALRPIAESKVTVILATLPGRQAEDAFKNTNIGGRQEVITVSNWEVADLVQIAKNGFETLNVNAKEELTERLAKESHGSPQIMQRLCLQLCDRVNGITQQVAIKQSLQEPANWTDFFRSIKDADSLEWIKTLKGGFVAGKPRNTFPDPRDGHSYDGYQLILKALHELGCPAEVEYAKVKARIVSHVGGRSSDLTTYALEQKASNMNTLASRDTSTALKNISSSTDTDDSLFTDEEIGLMQMIAQPVFEVVGKNANDMIIRILDPQLGYTLKWYPEAITS